MALVPLLRGTIVCVHPSPISSQGYLQSIAPVGREGLGGDLRFTAAGGPDGLRGGDGGWFDAAVSDEPSLLLACLLVLLSLSDDDDVVVASLGGAAAFLDFLVATIPVKKFLIDLLFFVGASFPFFLPLLALAALLLPVIFSVIDII